MTGATDPDGISFAELGDEIDPVTESATQASSIQNALNNRILYSYRWPTVAEKNAQVNMQEGDTGFQSDTNSPFIYVGLNLGWMPIGYGTGRQLAGSNLVSVTGATTDWSGSLAISFPPGYFSATPYIVTSAFTSNPAEVHCSPNQPTSAGFTMVLKRTNNVATTCFWFAVQAN